MKFHIYFFLIMVFTTIRFYAQTKINAHDSLSIETSINNKMKASVKLFRKYEYKKALTLIKRCIKKSDSIKNDSLLANSYVINGVIFCYLGEEAKAIHNHKKAIKIFRKIKNNKLIGVAYNNIALAYQENSKNLDSAKVYYKKAIDIYEHIGNTSRLALTATNLAEIYRELNELKKATLYTEKAILHAKTHNRKYILSSAYHNYAEIHFKKNNFKKALKYVNLSQEIAEKEDYETLLVLIYKLKSNILEEFGAVKNAHLNLKKYNEYLKHTHKIEKSRLIQEASVKFEVKENKALLAKAKLENTIKENRLKKSRQIVFSTVILLLISAVVSLLLYKNNDLKLENNKLLILKHEKLKELQHQTELNFLKTQIQPDFFFKTLTILQTLILEKSKNAKEVVIKLSELMQYSIYESKKEKVSIWDEINNIQTYLELERLYKNQKTFPAIQINGNIENVMVPPLLYFSFVENYFKVNNTRKKNIDLTISFENTENTNLLFVIKNNISAIEFKKESKIEFEIQNIKRRLNLIYENKYSLITQNTDSTYRICLKTPIQLKPLPILN